MAYVLVEMGSVSRRYRLLLQKSTSLWLVLLETDQSIHLHSLHPFSHRTPGYVFVSSPSCMSRKTERVG